MDDHLSRPSVTRRLERRTRLLCGPRQRSLLRLAPNGVLPAAASPRRWWALTPPFHPYPRRLRRVFASGGFLSVPLSVGFRRLGFPQRPALRCPDFPRAGESPARGHPACRPNCSPVCSARSRRSASPHCGQETVRGPIRTNSPQTRHSRLAPRARATSSWSSVRLSGVTVTASGTPRLPCRPPRRGGRRSARARRSPAGGGRGPPRGTAA